MAYVVGDDGDSWARAVAGDRGGLAQLYDRHATAIFNHCYQRLVSRADAEDITAEVFIVALKSGARLHVDPDAGLRPTGCCEQPAAPAGQDAGCRRPRVAAVAGGTTRTARHRRSGR